MSAPLIAVRFFHEIAARSAESLADDARHPVRRHILTVALSSYRDARDAMATDDQAVLDPFFDGVKSALEAAQ